MQHSSLLGPLVWNGENRVLWICPRKPIVSNAFYTDLQRGSWHIGFYTLVPISFFTGNPLRRGKLGTVDFLIKIGCYVKKENVVSIWKVTELSYLVQGGQPYWFFHFSKVSLPFGFNCAALTPSIMTLSITTQSKVSLWMMTFSIMTLSVIGLIVTLSTTYFYCYAVSYWWVSVCCVRLCWM
jgi:hypothetical protein